MAQYFVDPAGGQTELDRFSLKREGRFYIPAVLGTDGGRDVFEFPRTSNEHTFLGFDEAGQIADSEVLILIRTDATGFSKNGGIAQRAGSVTAYAGSIIGSNRYRLFSIVNATGSIVADPNPAGIVTTTYSYIRQRITGNQIKIRAWDETSSEPTSWLVETTDTTIPAAGFSGIYGDTTEPFYVAAWSLGTNGDSAPIAPVASGPNTPINLGTASLLTTSARLTWEQG